MPSTDPPGGDGTCRERDADNRHETKMEGIVKGQVREGEDEVDTQSSNLQQRLGEKR